MLYMPMRSKASNARKQSELSLAISAQLRAERGALSMSFDTLAAKSGVSKTTLLAIFNDERIPDVTQLDAICRALKVRVIDLFRRAEERVAAQQQQAHGQAAVSGE